MNRGNSGCLWLIILLGGGLIFAFVLLGIAYCIFWVAVQLGWENTGILDAFKLF